MENLESLKNKLIRAVNESTDRALLMSIWKYYQEQKNIFEVSEPKTIYEENKPMTDEEVEKYFEEEKIILPDTILEILKLSEEDIKNGRTYTNEEVNTYFEEWLND